MYPPTSRMIGEASCPLNQIGQAGWPVVPIQVSSDVVAVPEVQRGNHIGGERSASSDKASPAGHNE